jgi:hypothetical protein
MHSRSNATLVRTLLALVALTATGAFARADEWQVAKATGEVWITSATAQSVSLTTSSVLRPGEKIQTGKNGRVLLTRGAETILIAPNSLIGLPAPQTPDRTTTILQQAGSIVLEVEKRNVEHFAVETPFLAAVVKGTRFAVDVGQNGADVRVLSGSVNVSSFKSGQFALVSAGQEARVAAFGRGNLTLGGSGPIGPVLKGPPRSPTLQRVPVPAKGFNLPRGASLGPPPAGVPSNIAKLDGHVRIVAPIGAEKLNIRKLTNGLARSGEPARAGRHRQRSQEAPTVWDTTGSGLGKQYGVAGNGAGGNSGNGNGGNGNSNANAGGGNNSNGPGNGNGNGGGNGNGHGHGKGKGKGKGKGN